MMDKISKIRLMFLIPVLLLALCYPVQKILEYDFPDKPPRKFRFKVSGVDPYDPVRGRYITLNVIVPELKTKDFTYRKYRFAVLKHDSNGHAEVTELRQDCAPDIPCVRINYLGVRHIWKGNRIKKHGMHNFRFPFTRYFINENNAKDAEELLRKAKNAELIVHIYPNGNYAVRDLIIDGKPIMEALKK